MLFIVLFITFLFKLLFLFEWIIDSVGHFLFVSELLLLLSLHVFN